MLDTRPATLSPLLTRPLGEIVDGIAEGEASIRDAGLAAVASETSAGCLVAACIDLAEQPEYQPRLMELADQPLPAPASEPVRPVREALAIDGKVLRGSQPKREDEADSVPGTDLVAANVHASGLVRGQVRAAGKGHELAAAKALLKLVPIAGRVVTADALLTQRDVSEQIVRDHGDYLFPIDSNQPALLADAEAALFPLDGGPASADRPADGGDDPAELAPA